MYFLHISLIACNFNFLYTFPRDDFREDEGSPLQLIIEAIYVLKSELYIKEFTTFLANIHLRESSQFLNSESDVIITPIPTENELHNDEDVLDGTIFSEEYCDILGTEYNEISWIDVSNEETSKIKNKPSKKLKKDSYINNETQNYEKTEKANYLKYIQSDTGKKMQSLLTKTKMSWEYFETRFIDFIAKQEENPNKKPEHVFKEDIIIFFKLDDHLPTILEHIKQILSNEGQEIPENDDLTEENSKDPELSLSDTELDECFGATCIDYFSLPKTVSFAKKDLSKIKFYLERYDALLIKIFGKDYQKLVKQSSEKQKPNYLNIIYKEQCTSEKQLNIEYKEEESNVENTKIIVEKGLEQITDQDEIKVLEEEKLNSEVFQKQIEIDEKNSKLSNCNDGITCNAVHCSEDNLDSMNSTTKYFKVEFSYRVMGTSDQAILILYLDEYKYPGDDIFQIDTVDTKTSSEVVNTCCTQNYAINSSSYVFKLYLLSETISNLNVSRYSLVLNDKIYTLELLFENDYLEKIPLCHCDQNQLELF